MDNKIKTLLRLESIPNYRLSESDKKILEEWKRNQKPVEIKPKRTYTRRKKTTNEVKEEQKETGKIEIEDATPEVGTVNVNTFWEVES